MVWFAFMTLQQCCMALRKSGTLASFPTNSCFSCQKYMKQAVIEQCNAAAASLAALVCNNGMTQNNSLAVTKNWL